MRAMRGCASWASAPCVNLQAGRGNQTKLKHFLSFTKNQGIYIFLNRNQNLNSIFVKSFRKCFSEARAAPGGPETGNLAFRGGGGVTLKRVGGRQGLVPK